jgi:type II secretory pathway pseudopilin PulG
MKLRPKSAAGFTLLEIILAVGIGVIFMGGAVVFLSSTGGDRELIQTRKMLEEAAGEAREKALATGKSQRIVVTISEINSQPIPEEVELSLSVAARKAWTQYEKGYLWLVTGGGLVEPIRVRLRHGENQDEFEFSALTGESVTRRQEGR